MITHEETKKVFEKLQEIILITLDLDVYLDECDLIQNYIKQQEKKEEQYEELLKLYKHLNKLEHLDELQITAYTLYDINVLKSRIKELENGVV